MTGSFVRLQSLPDGLVDVLELRVTVGMLCAFESFAISLQAVAQFLE